MSRRLTLEFDRLPSESVSCGACLDRLEERLRLVSGISNIELLPKHRKVVIGLADGAEPAYVEAVAQNIMSEVAAGFGHESLRVGGMDCPACAREIETTVSGLPGILACAVDFPTARMNVEFDRSRVETPQIQREVRNLGFSAQPLAAQETESPRGEAAALAAGAGLWLAGLLIPAPAELRNVLYAGAVIASGWRMLQAGVTSLAHGKFTTNALMTVAVVGAAAIGEWREAAAVAWLFALGNLLQARAMRSTRSAVRALMDAAPKTAARRKEGGAEAIDVRQVRPGDLIEVTPYSQIPVDGVVVEGGGYVNNSALTGESMPQAVEPGSRVLAGGVAEGGFLVVRADRAFSDTTYAKMLDIIERGQSARAPQQQMIDRFSGWYTPTVIGASVLFATLGPLMGWRTWQEGLHQAFWLLMVACPCALVISTPVAIVTAIGVASRFGALAKGGAHLEALSKVRHWVFDKTGTLTHARLEVVAVEPAEGVEEKEAVRLAAALGRRSEHPVSRAVARRAMTMKLPEAESLVQTPGKGTEGIVEGRRLKLGSAAFTEVSDPFDKTVAYLVEDGRPLARFELADLAKMGAAEVIAAVRAGGVSVTLFSGDDRNVVARLAESLLIGDARPELSPDQKAEEVARLSEQGGVAMVGDGINDVAALQRATVGIAMGAAGSDAAIESADIVLLNDDIRNVSRLVRLSRRLRSVLAQNIIFSLGTKAALLAAGTTIVLPFWLAVAGDMGVALCVTANALALRLGESRKRGERLSVVSAR